MADLRPTDVLFIPNRRRLTHAMLAGPEGKEELHIFYGSKEIVIDEPDLLSFGNKLLSVERFRADEATAWSSEAPYDWERIRGLLEALVAEEILKHFEEAPPPVIAQTFPAHLGRAPPGRQPETWSAHDNKCPALAQRAFGREFDLGNLEVFVPVHRVAHPAVDKDGRQVGENNVMDTLFLDLPTDRRVCNYPGSRYHADTSINSTALKNMVRRWPELLSLTEQFRTAFFAHLPPRGKALQAGEIHLLSVTCLSVVGYVMVRGVDPVPNGQLDAGLAAMFRLIDGVRIVTTHLTRDTAGTHGCELTLNARGVHDHAERFSLFLDTWGVCAGPAALIDEYLQVLLEGVAAPIQAQPDVASRVGDLSAAIDYGLHGVRVEAMVRTFAALQGLLHERLRLAFQQHAIARTKLQEILEIPIDVEHYPFLREQHPFRETMEMEIRVGRWLFDRARDGLPSELPSLVESIDELSRRDPASLAVSHRRLAEFMMVVPDYGSLPEPLRDELVAVAVELFALERATLRAMGREQQMLNQRLRRPQGRALSGQDLATYARRATPALERVLAEGLGIEITVEAGSSVLSHGQHSLSLAD